jgi:signal transduction histidine kinase
MGLGFDMDKVKNKIFGLYEKFHDNMDSNGIGLYLVYNHVTNLGGHIRVESKIDEGAEFIITFRA